MTKVSRRRFTGSLLFVTVFSYSSLFRFKGDVWFEDFVEMDWDSATNSTSATAIKRSTTPHLNIETQVREFSAAFKKARSINETFLCLQPPSVDSMSLPFVDIPVVNIPVSVLQKRMRSTNDTGIIPPSWSGRTGNHVVVFMAQIQIAIMCRKISIFPEAHIPDHLGPDFFAPCWDFSKLQPAVNSTDSREFCDSTVNSILLQTPESKNRQTSTRNSMDRARAFIHLPKIEQDKLRLHGRYAASVHVLRYHLMNTLAKQSYKGRHCGMYGTGDLEIVMHVRSGDIFRPPSHYKRHKKLSRYGQPPLQYYVSAAKQVRATRVTVLSENLLNPVVDALREYTWSNATVVETVEVHTNGTTFDQVLEKLLCARAIACSASTLSSFLILSTNARQIFLPSAPVTKSQRLKIPPSPIDSTGNSLSIWEYQMKGPYSVFDQWTNTPTQREEMLQYTGGYMKALSRDIPTRL